MFCASLSKAIPGGGPIGVTNSTGDTPRYRVSQFESIQWSRFERHRTKCSLHLVWVCVSQFRGKSVRESRFVLRPFVLAKGRCELSPPVVFADGPALISVDSSDEEGAHLPHAPSQTSSAVPPKQSATIPTQTPGSWLDHIQALAENFSLTVIEMKPLKNQFWAHFLACMKMPRGGGERCRFDALRARVRGAEREISTVSHGRSPSPPREPLQSINCIPSLGDFQFNQHLPRARLPSHRQLHAPPSPPSRRFFRAYRGSVLAAPPNSYPAPVEMLSAIADRVLPQEAWEDGTCSLI